MAFTTDHSHKNELLCSTDFLSTVTIGRLLFNFHFASIHMFVQTFFPVAFPSILTKHECVALIVLSIRPLRLGLVLEISYRQGHLGMDGHLVAHR